MKYGILLWVFFFLLCDARAEYRVFLLRIGKKPQPGAAADAPTDYRLVESTLDPQQYPYYHPVAPDEEVTYTETWRCYGRTDGFKPHCPNPKGQIPPTEEPAS